MNYVNIIGNSVRCEICCVWNSVNHMCFYSSVFYLTHIKMYLFMFSVYYYRSLLKAQSIMMFSMYGRHGC